MKIATDEQYNNIRNNVILKVILIGDKWNDDCGEVFDVIKIDDKLYELPQIEAIGYFQKEMKKTMNLL